MKVTDYARRLWLLRRGPLFLRPPHDKYLDPVLIDRIVNQNGNVHRLTSEPNNTLVCLRHARKRGEDLVAYLGQLSRDMQSADAKRRRAYATKWRRRIVAARARTPNEEAGTDLAL